VRQLEREIQGVLRKVARQVVEDGRAAVKVTPKNLEEFAGQPKVMNEVAGRAPEVGVATGLAWTPSGGDIIFIEAIQMPGRGQITLTGQLGDVMRESVDAACSYVRSMARPLRIEDAEMKATDLHIHFPAGSVPKDGPSAGVAVTLAIASVMSRRAVRRDVAVTGEVTLRGKVLEIGGVKEKVLAAYRAGLREVILPAANEKDLRGLPDTVRNQMRITFAASMEQVLEQMLLAPVQVTRDADVAGAVERRLQTADAPDDAWTDRRTEE